MAYAYAGGFTLGVEPWFDVFDHYEDAKPYGKETVEINNAGIEIHADDWSPVEDVDVVFANPPCAPFSPASYRKGAGADKWVDDPRLSCHENVAILGARTDATIVVMESVRQSLKAKSFYDQLTRDYLPDHQLYVVEHNAKHHDLPQNRPRVFWVWSTVPFEPTESESVCVLQSEHLQYPDAQPIRKLNENTKQILPHVPPGKALRPFWSHPPGVRGIPSTACRRLAWDQPTPAMSGIRGYVHPDEDRYITVPELKDLCGYPQSYEFAGRPQAQVLQMVRAVLPPVGYWIAEQCKLALR